MGDAAIRGIQHFGNGIQKALRGRAAVQELDAGALHGCHEAAVAALAEQPIGRGELPRM